MRFIHTSDWHLGRRLHSADLHEDHRAFLTWLLQEAQTRSVQAVVVAGDIYDRAVPPAESVTLLDETIAAFAGSGIPLLLTSGNHDSAVRLRYGAQVLADSGIHLRTDLAGVTSPVILSDDTGPVGFYGVPFLLPDAVMDELGADRSHASVLAAVGKRIVDDAAERGLTRTVVAAHAFVTGSSACDSEREISVGGVSDVPADVFGGTSYVALGHLHGAQSVTPTGSPTVVQYSGSPLAFSFSERDQVKSVTIVDIDGAGGVTTQRVATPTRRSLRQVTGRLPDLLERASGDLADLADAWVKVTLTDTDRPSEPMAQLRAVWPHTLLLEFQPDLDPDVPAGDLVDVTRGADPTDVLSDFFRHVTGNEPDGARIAVMRQAAEALQSSAAEN